jgi:hypothetical protein
MAHLMPGKKFTHSAHLSFAHELHAAVNDSSCNGRQTSRLTTAVAGSALNYRSKNVISHKTTEEKRIQQRPEYNASKYRWILM